MAENVVKGLSPLEAKELVDSLSDEELDVLSQDELKTLDQQLEKYEQAMQIKNEPVVVGGAPEDKGPVGAGEAFRLNMVEGASAGFGTELMRMGASVGMDDNRFTEEGLKEAAASRQGRIEQSREEQGVASLVGGVVGGGISAVLGGLGLKAGAAALGTTAPTVSGLKAAGALGALGGVGEAQTSEDIAEGRIGNRVTGGLVGGGLGVLTFGALKKGGVAARKLSQFIGKKASPTINNFKDKMYQGLRIGEGTVNNIEDQAQFKMTLDDALEHIYHNADDYLNKNNNSYSDLQRSVNDIGSKASAAIKNMFKEVSDVDMSNIDDATSFVNNLTEELGDHITKDKVEFSNLIFNYIDDTFGNSNLKNVLIDAIFEGKSLKGTQAGEIVSLLTHTKPVKNSLKPITAVDEKISKLVGRNIRDWVEGSFKKQSQNPAQYDHLKKSINAKILLDRYMVRTVNRADKSSTQVIANSQQTLGALINTGKQIAGALSDDLDNVKASVVPDNMLSRGVKNLTNNTIVPALRESGNALKQIAVPAGAIMGTQATRVIQNKTANRFNDSAIMQKYYETKNNK